MFDRFIGSGWGSLELEVDAGPHSYGGSIDGSVSLTANRTMGPGRLWVALACVERQSRVVPTRGRFPPLSHHSRSKVLWHCETVLDDALTMEEGSSISHPWAVAVPADPSAMTTREELPEWATGTIAVIDALTFADRSIVWEIRGRFSHGEGFTLRDHRRVDLV